MKVNIKKLAVSAMLTAVAVSLSGFSIPIGASKCFPVQHLANVLAARVRYSQQSSLSDFVSQINSLRDEDSMKRLTIKSVEQKLMEDGNFEEYYVNGIPRKRLTDKGREFGIEAEKRLSEKGNEYEVFFYGERAQRGIVEWLWEKI